MVYEPESGLVYTETVLKSCDCLPKIPDAPKDAPSKRRRTLYEMARRRLLDNIDKLGPDALAALPTALAERVWPASRRGQMSVQLWKIMAQSQPDLVTGTPHRWEYICKSCRRLPDVIQIADCSAFYWLCNLTLDCNYVQAEELYRVPNLVNIRSVAVRGSRSCAVHDRVFRAWGDAAVERGAFSRLLTIAISYTTRGPLLEDIAQFLDRLRCFPALETLCVHDESTRFPRRTASGKRYGSFRCLDRRKCPTASGAPIASPLPLLQMMLGTNKSEGVPHDHRTACFRRSSHTPTRPSQESSVPVSEPEMPNKRRKLKEGKSFSLDSLLDGF
ncbi:hypothetical protein LTR22_024381 [Elasticomyces elasticus]|nr:hypothetical protein LTR22_024381 [Elasticomyces elasticus]KAK4926641.1 hypothetical protein LTR49_006575 [Elasticomyces elasticus]